MLNPATNPNRQSVKFNNVFRNTGIEVSEKTTGKIFNDINFATNWESIYVKPSDLSFGNVSIGMRKLTEPTLLVTTKQSKMAFVLATTEEPIYIRPFEFNSEEYGFLLAYTLVPLISPEFVYYLCKYKYWDRIVNNINKSRVVYKEHKTIWEVIDGSVSWNHIGKDVLWIGHEENQSSIGVWESVFPLTAPMLKNAIGDFRLPSPEKQEELIKAAKTQDKKIASYSHPKCSVSELVNKYLTLEFNKGLTFSSSGVDLLLECYLIAAGDSANEEVKDILFNNNFIEGVFTQEELSFLAEHLDEVFDIIICKNSIRTEYSPNFIQPQEVTDFMCEMASFPMDVIVYNPFAGADSFALVLPNPIEGEELDRISWALGQIRLFANGVTSRSHFELGDSFKSIESNKKYRAIISSPAYLAEKGNKIGDIVGMLYNKLEDGGTLVCLVNQSFLFENVGISSQIRKRLIEDKAMKAVFNIPNNIFTWSGVNQSVIVITKGIENEHVILGDASDYTRFAKSNYRQTTFDWEQFVMDMEEDIIDFGERGNYVIDGDIATIVNYSEILDLNLSPNIYLSPKPENGISLSSVATEIKECREDGTADYYIVGSSLPEALHRKPFILPKRIDKKSSSKGYQVSIKGDAVLLAIVSGNVRTVYVEDFHGTIAFPGGFIKVLKPGVGVSAKYLAALLSTKIVADQIRSQAMGLTIPRLNKLDLSHIIVPDYNTVEERQKLISEVLSSEMSELETELKDTLETHKREVRSTRHAMIQTLSALSSNWGQLKRFADKNGGQINYSDSIGQVNPISIENLLESIGYAISTLERQVESLRFEKADWGKDVEINPYVFINEYISTHSTPDVKMVNVGSDNTADIPELNDETGEVTFYHTDAMSFFSAPKRLLERIFNNIVSNAKAHGFTSEIQCPEIRFDWQEVNGDVVITVANNGRSLKDGVTSDDVLMSGFSTSLNESSSDGTLHSGHGGFEIKSLMEGLGSVEVLSEPSAEFPVIYKLTFTNTNTVLIC